MKAIITKYALSSGIEVVECAEVNGFRTLSIRAGNQCFHEPDWHKTKGSATSRVLQILESKRASLQKQLAAIDSKAAKALKAIEAAEL